MSMHIVPVLCDVVDWHVSAVTGATFVSCTFLTFGFVVSFSAWFGAKRDATPI